MRQVQYLWAMFMALFLVACTGLPPAQSPAENVLRGAIYAQKQADAAEKASIYLLQQRMIGSDEAQKVADAAVKARAAAVAARTSLDLGETPDNALAILKAAQTSLMILEQFLAEHGK